MVKCRGYNRHLAAVGRGCFATAEADMILVQNCRMIDPASQTDGLRDILIGEDRITKIAEAGTIDPAQITKEKEDELRILNADGLIAAPGLVDTHVHFRDPGAEYKEDILTGAVSAAAGGVTSVVLMANTNPHVDQEETLSYVLEKGAKTGIHVYTCANVTMDMEGDELTDMEALAKAGAVGFTDDGKPLLDAKIARKAMQEAARVHKPISFHEENPEFNVAQFGCEWAYTMDGGEVGELEFENFNAASAKISFKGRNVHPGYAKNKMINSIRVANRFMSMLPADEAPEHTEGYEGFYHLIGITGEVEQTTVSYIIRDHDRTRFEERKKEMERLVAKINEEYGPGTATLELRDQYYNMREQIEPVMHIIDTAFAAMKAVGVEPRVKAIRGGTDGAQLSFKGLPCPNIFAGGLNFHGRYEFVPIQNMEKAMNVIVKIAELVASK